MADWTCTLCRDSQEPGWLCAEHAGKPWGRGGCRACGVRCACNPYAEVQCSPMFEEFQESPEDRGAPQ